MNFSPQKVLEDVFGYAEFRGQQQAIIEASRCVQCGMCHEACPTHMDAPEYIRAIWQDDLEEAVRQIYQTNPFAQAGSLECGALAAGTGARFTGRTSRIRPFSS